MGDFSFLLDLRTVDRSKRW